VAILGAVTSDSVTDEDRAARLAVAQQELHPMEDRLRSSGTLKIVITEMLLANNKA
jgi:hypothetical protein